MLPLEHSAILLICIKRLFVLKTNFRSFKSGRFTQVLLYVFVFSVAPTAKVKWRWGYSFKSHPTDWSTWGSNLRLLVYKVNGLSTTSRRLLFVCFVALRHKSTVMVMVGRSVHLTTLFPGQA